MMTDRGNVLVKLEVRIDPEVLKRVVKEGRVSEFVNTFPTLAGGHLKGQIVEQLATGEFGPAAILYDEEYATVPPMPPLPFIDTVPLPESRLRLIIREEMKQMS
jgi:hypothetical protein